VSVVFVSFVSLWPCDGLATCSGALRLSPNDSWDRLQLPHDPTDGYKMDGWVCEGRLDMRTHINYKGSLKEVKRTKLNLSCYRNKCIIPHDAAVLGMAQSAVHSPGTSFIPEVNRQTASPAPVKEKVKNNVKITR